MAASQWREIFDRSLCMRLRDEVWKLLPDHLRCMVLFEQGTGHGELLIIIEDARRHRAMTRGFRFVLPPLEEYEAREWMDNTGNQIASITGSIGEHLPGIIAEFAE
jgi:hypothetical protein